MTNMTKEEMLERIKQLEQENMKLKNEKLVKNIVGSMTNQAELNFIYPFYSTIGTEGWRRSTVGSFNHLRDLAMSTVDKVNNNTFEKQKVKDLSRDDLLLAVECADEIALVVAKYKKKYLQSIGREDIIEAFNM